MKPLRLRTTLVLWTAVSLLLPNSSYAAQSVARKWNEVLLSAIRRDLARPTVTARTLFHSSVAAYDAWAAYDNLATPFLLGKTVGAFNCPFSGNSS